MGRGAYRGVKCTFPRKIAALLSATLVLPKKAAVALFFLFWSKTELERYLGCNPNSTQGTPALLTRPIAAAFLDFLNFVL